MSVRSFAQTFFGAVLVVVVAFFVTEYWGRPFIERLRQPDASPTLPGDVWQECETYMQEICGIWARGPDNRWRGEWASVQADLTIAITGNNVTVARRDLTSPLQATYRGTLNVQSSEIIGTVDWCCDQLGNRSGTWWARITDRQRFKAPRSSD